MEIHRELGMGFKEAVYKEALEIEFLDKAIPFERERCFEIEYKGKVLRQHYRADFILLNDIVLEVKARLLIIDAHLIQTIHYLKVSGIKLGIIANFGQKSFQFKRVVF